MKLFINRIIYDRNFKYLLILSAFWIVSSIIVNPIGNFPLNDDWAYSKNVYYLSEFGIFKYSNWPAMTLLSQMLWGTVFCKIFGFSFSVLRISVIIIGLIGANIIFLLAKLLSNNNKLALITTLVLIYNPYYFSLSHTFMTEIPFLISSLFSIFFYYKYLEENCNLINIILATVFSIIAVLNRQTGLLFPITFALSFFIINRKFNKNLFIVFLSVFLVIQILLYYQNWLKLTGNLSSNYANVSDLTKILNYEYFEDLIFERSWIILFYNGILLLPFLLLIFSTYWKNLEPKEKLLIFFLALFLTRFTITIWDKLPIDNIVFNFGIGPKKDVIKDCYWGINSRPALHPGIIQIIKILGSIGSFFIIFFFLILCSHIKRILSIFNFSVLENITTEKEILFNNLFGNKLIFSVKFFSLVFIIGYWIYLLLNRSFFDRYIIILLPFFIILFIPNNYIHSLIFSSVSLILICLLIFFSIAGTHDYISWNRARWAGLDSLTNHGISPQLIDGGFEFNGWFETGPENPILKFEKSWWFVHDDLYLIAFGDFYNYKKIKKYTFPSYLTFGNDSIFVLKKLTASEIKINISP